MCSKDCQSQFHFVTINPMWIFLELNQRHQAKNAAIIRKTSLEQAKCVDQSPSEAANIYSRNPLHFCNPKFHISITDQRLVPFFSSSSSARPITSRTSCRRSIHGLYPSTSKSHCLAVSKVVCPPFLVRPGHWLLVRYLFSKH
jgi:hypothetical protein